MLLGIVIVAVVELAVNAVAVGSSYYYYTIVVMMVIILVVVQ